MPKYVIAYKRQPHPSKNMGFIQPVIIEDDDQKRIVDQEDFPNRGTIFVHREYGYLDEKFDEDALFRIRYSENQNTSSIDQDDENYCKYIASGKDIDLSGKLKYEYFHVIEGTFNNTDLRYSLNHKPSRYIFIHDKYEGYIYGPFDFEGTTFDHDLFTYNIQLKPLEAPQYLNIPKYCVVELPSNVFRTINAGKDRILLADIQAIRENLDKAKYVDCVSDEQLINWGNNLIERTEDKLKKDTFNAFRSAIEKIQEINEPFFNERYKRLQQLATKTNSWLTYRSTFISDYLKTDAGKKEIDRYLDDTKDSYLSYALEKYDQEARQQYDYDETSKRYYQELEGLQKDIKLKKEEKNILEIELKETTEALKMRKEKDIGEELSKQQIKLNNIQKEFEIKKSEFEELTEQLNIAKEIGQLRVEHGVLKRREEELKENLTKSHEALVSTKSAFQKLRAEDGRDLHRRLIEAKSVFDALDSDGGEGIILAETKLPSSVGIQAAPNSARDFVRDIQKKLKEQGRDLPEEIVANYLITAHQSFLTIFAGLPGTGKTSLVALLAKSLGMTSSSRFIDIRTSRGWTSQRDILGFYNPLNQRFQESATGLYKALRQCEQETEHYPYWILLDEANLSPLEHYWSSFLIMCDEEGRRIINTGEPGNRANLRISESIRFLGTVNYDSTTEPLSPRMIDRVAIIYLEPSEQPIEFDSLNDEISDNGIYNYQDLDSLLICKSLDFTEGEQRIFEIILRTLHFGVGGVSIIISPRKQKQIRKFCSTARELMKVRYDLCALDYAVAQHVLPLINGSGAIFKDLLSKFREEIGPLDYSKRLLKRIIERGEQNHHFYSFFC